MEKTRRSTKTKQLVMGVLEQSSSALCHEDIERELGGQVDRVTIYRILQGFQEEGKVHKIIDEGGKSYYALCFDCSEGHHHDNHAHFRCLKCHRITCLEASMPRFKLPEGYRATAVHTLISGYCPHCLPTLKAALTLLLCWLFPFAAGAQQADSLRVDTASVHHLEEVVVSAPGTRLQGETVINVDKLSLAGNVAIAGSSLAAKLSNIAGVSNWSTGAGIGKPVIRGLSGNRIAVYSQGIRMENQQWGEEHGLGLDENGLGHVEVIKGPASLLYGSDALGGVLYFVDEPWADPRSVGGRVATEYNSNGEGWRTTGALKASTDRFHWNLFGEYTTHKDYKDGDNHRVDNTRFHTGNFKTAIGYDWAKVHSTLKYSYLNEQYGLTEADTDIPNNSRRPAFPYQRLNTHILSSENTIYLNNDSRLTANVGYMFNNRKEFEDSRQAALDMNLGTLSYNVKWYSPQWAGRWSLIGGSQGSYQKNSNHGEETLIPDATTTDAGVFVISNLHYTDRAYWQAGLRFDGRHVASSQHGTEGEEGYFPSFAKTYYAFNFSTGIYQPIGEKSSLRVNLSSGYRTPNMFELLSDGVHEGTNRFERGNRGLKTENSYQLDASYQYHATHFSFFASPYFNYIRHFIYVAPAGTQVDGYDLYNYAQEDAYLFGGEAGFHLHPHPLDWLHLEASYSNTFGRTREAGADLPLMPSQKLNATVSATFTARKALRRFSVYANNRYSFAQHCVAANETATPAYNLFNLGMNFNFQLGRQPLQLSLAADNLFNDTYYDHLSRYKTEGIYNQGRNVNVKVTIPLL
ncbi:MAG: TonB-dependent receptor [Mediterranea sp.]|jgi:iron complex outermembrane receptor protein|nr:TonB-dependent receptor [Mediterranea sp.]